MKAPSHTASKSRRIICPFCESGKLISFGHNLARCDSCGLPLLGSTLETLRDVIGLPDALGAHPCECGHPEMRELPDRVFHCPACGLEVLPVEAPSVSEIAHALDRFEPWREELLWAAERDAAPRLHFEYFASLHASERKA